MNVGCVAEALVKRAGRILDGLIPDGAATLAALHDVGKISTGVSVKVPGMAGAKRPRRGSAKGAVERRLRV